MGRSSGCGFVSGSSGRWIEIEVAGPNPVRGLDRPAVDPHALGVDDLLKHLPGIVGEPAGQVRIDPLPIDARLDFKFQGRLESGGGHMRVEIVGSIGFRLSGSARPAEPRGRQRSGACCPESGEPSSAVLRGSLGLGFLSRA